MRWLPLAGCVYGGLLASSLCALPASPQHAAPCRKAAALIVTLDGAAGFASSPQVVAQQPQTPAKPPDSPQRAAQQPKPPAESPAATRPERAGSAPPPSRKPPMTEVRRIALLIPDPSRDADVIQAVAAERAMSLRRRRPSLFAPQPPAPSGAGKRVGTARGAVPKNPRAAGPYASWQLDAIAEWLFFDSLADRLEGRLNVQIVPQTDTMAAVKELGLSTSDAPAGATLATLCGRLNCDGVVVARLDRVRALEADTRALAVWATVRLVRPTGAPPGRGVTARAAMVEHHVAGAALSDKAPFQDRYVKEWPQLALEASKQAAGVAARTLATGVNAPFTLERDRVAIAPVVAPAEADALVFHPGGRAAAPAALRRLPTDVSGYFHPYLLPIFPDAIVPSRATAFLLGPGARRGETLWTKSEAPDVAAARALGQKTRAQYVLMARISDLQLALTGSAPVARGPAAAAAPPSTVDPATDAPMMETATAEAIGALVRVSDGAILWNERTTATMTAGKPGPQPESVRRRVAVDAVRFSLVQLERRFRQYRLRFE